MMRAAWSAPTGWNTVKARADGRSRWQATLRFRAKVRRLEVAKRLDELRRAQLATPWDPSGPIPSWIPQGAVKTLAAEFHVTEDTIRQDIHVIDIWPDPAPPRKRARVCDPRFAWARQHQRKPFVLRARVRLRLAPDVLAQIRARGEVQQVIRQAIVAGRAQTRPRLASEPKLPTWTPADVARLRRAYADGGRPGCRAAFPERTKDAINSAGRRYGIRQRSRA